MTTSEINKDFPVETLDMPLVSKQIDKNYYVYFRNKKGLLSRVAGTGAGVAKYDVVMISLRDEFAILRKHSKTGRVSFYAVDYKNGNSMTPGGLGAYELHFNRKGDRILLRPFGADRLPTKFFFELGRPIKITDMDGALRYATRLYSYTFLDSTFIVTDAGIDKIPLMQLDDTSLVSAAARVTGTKPEQDKEAPDSEPVTPRRRLYAAAPKKLSHSTKKQAQELPQSPKPTAHQSEQPLPELDAKLFYDNSNDPVNLVRIETDHIRDTHSFNKYTNIRINNKLVAHNFLLTEEPVMFFNDKIFAIAGYETTGTGNDKKVCKVFLPDGRDLGPNIKDAMEKGTELILSMHDGKTVRLGPDKLLLDKHPNTKYKITDNKIK